MKSESLAWLTRVARATKCARSGPLPRRTRRQPAHETARGGGIPRALELLQNRPRTSPELQLSPNAIFLYLKPSQLTPWLSWNSPTRTPNNLAHDGGDTARPRRPPGTCADPPNGSVTIFDPSGYAKRRCGVI